MSARTGGVGLVIVGFALGVRLDWLLEATLLLLLVGPPPTSGGAKRGGLDVELGEEAEGLVEELFPEPRDLIGSYERKWTEACKPYEKMGEDMQGRKRTFHSPTACPRGNDLGVR